MRKLCSFLFIVVGFISIKAQRLIVLSYEVNAVSLNHFNGTVAHYLDTNKYGLLGHWFFDQHLDIGIFHSFKANKPFSFAPQTFTFVRYSSENANDFMKKEFVRAKHKALNLQLNFNQQSWEVYHPKLSIRPINKLLTVVFRLFIWQMITTFFRIKLSTLGTFTENHGVYAGLIERQQRCWITQLLVFVDYQFTFTPPLWQKDSISKASAILNALEKLNDRISLALSKIEIYNFRVSEEGIFSLIKVA